MLEGRFLCNKGPTWVIKEVRMFRFLRWQGVGALMVVGLMGCLNEGSKNESPKGVMEQTEAAPIELPRCEPSDARIRVDYWMPEYLEWKSSLSSVPEERNGRVVYINRTYAEPIIFSA